MKMNPIPLDEMAYAYRASGNVIQVYDTNAYGDRIPVTFVKDPQDPTVFYLPYTPCGEVTCDVD
jgi:hypothetical protein